MCVCVCVCVGRSSCQPKDSENQKQRARECASELLRRTRLPLPFSFSRRVPTPPAPPPRHIHATILPLSRTLEGAMGAPAAARAFRARHHTMRIPSLLLLLLLLLPLALAQRTGAGAELRGTLGAVRDAALTAASDVAASAAPQGGGRRAAPGAGGGRGAPPPGSAGGGCRGGGCGCGGRVAVPTDAGATGDARAPSRTAQVGCCRPRRRHGRRPSVYIGSSSGSCGCLWTSVRQCVGLCSLWPHPPCRALGGSRLGRL